MELPAEIWDVIVRQAKMSIDDVIKDTGIEKLREIRKQINDRIRENDEALLNQISVGDIVSIPNNAEYSGCLFQVQSVWRNNILDNNIYIQQVVPDDNGRVYGKFRREYGCGCKTYKSVHLLKIEISVGEQRNTLNEYISKLKIGDIIRYINRDGALLSASIGKMYSKYILTPSGDRVLKTQLVMIWVWMATESCGMIVWMATDMIVWICL